MANRLHRTLALVLSCNIAMTAFSVSALAADDTGASEGAAVVHAHNKVNCPNCGGDHKVEVEETCPACNGVLPEVPMVTCPNCDGKGEYVVWDWNRAEICPDCGGATNPGEECAGGNPDCIAGNIFPKDTCSTCNGTGEIPDPAVKQCETCGGAGTVTVEADCPDCGEDGQVDCPKTEKGFGEGTLTAVSEDGEGTMHFACDTCGAEYDEPLDAEQTTVLTAKHMEVTFAAEKTAIDAPKAPAGGAEDANRAAGLPVCYKLTIKNGNQVAVHGVSATVTLDGAVENIVAEGAVVDAEAKTVTLTLDELAAGGTQTFTITAQTSADAQLGGDIKASMTASLLDTVLAESESGVHINKYAAVKRIYVAGANMGAIYGSSAAPGTITAISSRKGETFDTLENKTFSFDGAFSGYAIQPGTDADGRVINSGDGRIWQCVGFVPYKGYSGNGDMPTLKNYVFGLNDSAEDGENEQSAVEEARAFVESSGGVLYGEAITEDGIHALESQVSDGCVTIMTVWALVEQAPLEIGDYGENGPEITPVSPVEYKATNGAEIAVGDVTPSNIDGHHYFDAELTITIPADAPESVHINLNDALAEISKKINAIDNNGVQPGDTIRYRLKLVNNSGKKYAYTAASASVGTIAMTDSTDGAFIGFDGNAIINSGEYTNIPRRMNNIMLRQLATDGRLSDAAIGAKLRALGYGSEEQTDEEITQKYLGCYYLDYMNRNRADGSKATSFHDLTPAEMAMLTDGATGTAVPETSESVAQAFYLYYYGSVYTFNGAGLYDCMNENGKAGSPADKAVSAALTGEDGAYIVTAVSGAGANNGFQMTKFGLGMQFDMNVVTEPSNPGGGGGGGRDHDPKPDPKPDPSNPGTVEIPDEETPTSPLDPETPAEEKPETPVENPLTEIYDEELPLADLSVTVPQTTSNVPKTGDASLLWLALSALSGIGLFFTNRRRREEK